MKLRYLIRLPNIEEPCTTCDPPCGRPRSRARYGLPDGTVVDAPQPGDVVFVEWADAGPQHACHWRWTNCDGRHLNVVLPNGHWWDVDSRASNCTLPDDTTHRCWVRHGDPTRPETLHVDKIGHTCSAGAGSILSGGYHGFLHNGELRPC